MDSMLDSPYVAAETYGKRPRSTRRRNDVGAPGGPLAPFATGLLGDDGAMRGGYRTSPQKPAGASPNPVPGSVAGATPLPIATGKIGVDSSIDYDPALVQIRAANGRNLGQARGAALEGKRKALLDFGDPQLAASILGANDPTLGAISSDPDHSTSVLARIARAYRDRTQQNEEALNQGNLFYSGYRGNVLKGLAQDQATETADATSGAQSALGQIGAALLAAENQAQDAEANGIVGAQGRMQANPVIGGADGAAGASADTGGAGVDVAGLDPAIARAMGLTGYNGSQLAPTPTAAGAQPLANPAITDALIAAALASSSGVDEEYANRVKRAAGR